MSDTSAAIEPVGGAVSRPGKSNIGGDEGRKSESTAQGGIVLTF